jgi:hypothetical protein
MPHLKISFAHSGALLNFLERDCGAQTARLIEESSSIHAPCKTADLELVC